MKRQPTEKANEGNGGSHSLLDLPTGWCWSTVSEVGEVKLGRQRSPEHHTGSHMRPYLRVANVYEDRLDLSDVMEMNFTPDEFEQYELRDGDILLNEGQSLEWVGRPALYRGEVPNCCFQNTLIRFRSSEAVKSRFALLIFRHYLHSGRFQKIARWTVNIAHLGAGRFTELEFPVPPLDEQDRIVAAAEELLSDLDAGVVALKRVQANLKRYRSAVLKAALEGRLTEMWRVEHRPSETGAQLLEGILKEHRSMWEAAQLAAFAAAEKEPPKNWQAKYKEPSALDTAALPALPNGWCWASLESLADLTGGLTKDQKRAGEEGVKEVPYLRVANVQRGYLDLEEIKVIHASEADIDALRLLPGDVLFTEGGDRDKLGRGWVWNGEVPDCIHQNHIFRARLLSPSVQPKFVSYHGNSFGQEWFTRAGKQTTNLASINLGMLRRFPVALPSAEEQQVIVEALETVLANVGEAEKEVLRGLARATRLRKSILKQAFEGKLVAQDAADEPASVLMARLRQQRMEVSSRSAGEAKKPRKLPRDVFLRRASIVSYTVRRLSAHKSFGRTQLEKTVHLTQSHLGVDLGFVFERYAAGPFDKDIYKLEGVARKNDWFTTQKRPKFGVTYHPGSKIEQMCQYATGHLGDRQAALDRLLDHIAGMNTDEAELFATAYASWNDLLIDSRPADEEAIIAEIHGWHEQKRRFTPDVIRYRLQWMRQNGYVPTGQGQRTRLIEKTT